MEVLSESGQQFDLLIRNGVVVDGTGNPWFRADIGIKDRNILKVDKALSPDVAKETIEANGLIVAPGFIDIHTHSDLTLLVNPKPDSMARQGVTTEVVGNCGMGVAPIKDETREMVKELYITEDFGVEIDWHTFAEYLDRLKEHRVDHNIAALVGHSAIRVAAMGLDSRLPTQEELEEMKSLVAQAMEDGAFGLSTGLEYAPGSNSDTNELAELSKVVAHYGRIYVSHIRNRDIRVLEAAEEAIEIGEKAGVPTHISHHGARFPGHGQSEEILRMIDEARKQGLEVTTDICVPWVRDGWDWGISPLTSMLPPWAFDGGIEELLNRLRDQEIRKQFKMYDNPQYKMMRLGLWDRILLGSCKTNPDLALRSFAEIANLRGVDDPYDVALDVLLAEGEELGNVLILGALYPEEDSCNMLRYPSSAITSDAIALASHGPLSKVSFGIYGCFPRLLAKYVRDRGILSLEDAIRKMTSLPAQIVGIRDRGLLREGMMADIVAFDLQRIEDRATFEDPNQYPEGMEYVIVNGQIVVKKGEHTGALPGRVLRA